MCELLIGLPDITVIGVDDGDGPVRVHVESRAPRPACAGCGSPVWVKDRPVVELVDLACFGRPARLVWHKHRWWCPGELCPVGSFTVEDRRIAAPRVALTDRAGRWVTSQVGRCGRTVSEVAGELGCDWHTVNNAVLAYGTALVDDPGRIGPVTALGLDETLFCRSGPWAERTWSTSIVDVEAGQLLDVVEGRSSVEPCKWLADRSQQRDEIRWATLDLSGPYRSVFDTMLPDARQVADPMLLLLSSGDWDDIGSGCEQAVDVASDVALEAAHRASAGLALADALVDVGAGRWVPSEANHDDAP